MRKLQPGAPWFAVFVLLVACVSGCGDGASDEPSVLRWPCPAGWVTSARGGCGPAVLLCVAGGGAAPGACNGVNVTRPSTIASPDGGTVRGFYRLPDGGIGGAWPEANWAPDAGIAECAEGWQRRDDGICDPVMRTDCPAGSEALPGGGCTPTAASDCPAGPYADPGAEAMGATIVHVRAGADSMRADGTEARPYATITAGSAAGGAGAWVLVAAGEYNEQVRPVGTKHILGVCAARVTLRGPGASLLPEGTAVIVSGRGGNLDLRGVTVTGNGHGLHAFAGATIRATAVFLRQLGEEAVIASGAGSRVELTGSVVWGTRRRTDGLFGRGVQVIEGGSFHGTRTVVTGNSEIGIFAHGGGTQVELNASVVRATRRRPNGTGGAGLFVDGGGSLRAVGVLIDDNADIAVVVSGKGTQAELTASVVRATNPRPAGDSGVGIAASLGGVLRLTGVMVDGNGAEGILSTDEGTQVEVTASVVRDTHLNADGGYGIGVIALEGGSIRATRLLITGNAGPGVVASGTGTHVEMSESIVRGAPPRGEGLPARGMYVHGGASLQASRVLLEGNPGECVVVAEPATEADLNECVVRGPLRGASTWGREGLWVIDGAAVRATGLVVEGTGRAGVVVSGMGAQLDLTGSVVRGVHPTSPGYFGTGINAQLGGTLRASLVLVADNAEAGVVVQTGAESIVNDLMVVGVSANRRGLGVGLNATTGARVDGTRVAIQAVGGAAVTSLPHQGVAGTRVTTRDLFARDVRPSTVRVNESGVTTSPEGRTVAYGLHAGSGCAIDATRAVIIAGGFGFFNAAGTVRIHDGVIANQLESAGAFDLSTPVAATRLENVAFVGNASSVVARRNDLPTASTLPPPPPPDLGDGP